jgi:hypothetical protein
MNTLETTIAWLVLAAALAGPTLYRLTRRTYRSYRIKRQRKMTPGPLLGTIYPKKDTK